MTLTICAVVVWGLTCSTEKGAIFTIFLRRVLMVNKGDSKGSLPYIPVERVLRCA